jgi:RNA polymerase sigma factor (sigma-70 family)
VRLGQLVVRSERRLLLRASNPISSYPSVGSDTPTSVETSPDREQEVERLYRTDGDRLWRALVAYCGNRDVADDAVSEAFAQVLARGEAIRDTRAWVWRATFRIAAGNLKSALVPIDASSEPTYEMPEPILDVVRALRTLSPNQRAAVILHDYADFPTKDVARIMDVAPATVRVHVSQARRRLRRLLGTPDA